MKTIIAGSRTIENYDLVETAIAASGMAISEVVSGGAVGADLYGERWARLHEVPVKRFPASWSEHGRAAGPIRNQQMAEYADQLIAVWDGLSHGTADMIRRARKQGLQVFVYEYGNT